LAAPLGGTALSSLRRGLRRSSTAAPAAHAFGCAGAASLLRRRSACAAVAALRALLLTLLARSALLSAIGIATFTVGLLPTLLRSAPLSLRRFQGRSAVLFAALLLLALLRLLPLPLTAAAVAALLIGATTLALRRLLGAFLPLALRRLLPILLVTPTLAALLVGAAAFLLAAFALLALLLPVLFVAPAFTTLLIGAAPFLLAAFALLTLLPVLLVAPAFAARLVWTAAFLLAAFALLALLLPVLLVAPAFTTLLIGAAPFLLAAFALLTLELMVLLVAPAFAPLLVGIATSSPIRLLPLAFIAPSRRARRVVAKTALLAGGKRLRVGNATARRLNDVACLAHRHLAAEIAVTELVCANLDRARNLRRSCQDARTYVVRTNRPPGDGSNDDRRNAWIDREPSTLVDDNGPIHDDRFANVEVVLRWRQNNRDEARSDDEVTGPAEDPHVRLVAILNDDLVRRQWRPADALAAASPLHETGAPLVAGDPHPTQLAIIDPAAIMESYPTPFRLLLVRGPVPAPIVIVDPASNRIGPPITADLPRPPDLAPPGMAFPSAVWLEGGSELGGNRNPLRLGGSGREGNRDHRCRHQQRRDEHRARHSGANA
jgi:hypothetical protein